jgi:hypothetical protein
MAKPSRWNEGNGSAGNDASLLLTVCYSLLGHHAMFEKDCLRKSLVQHAWTSQLSLFSRPPRADRDRYRHSRA